PERDALAVREAAPGQGAGLVGDGREQLANEARLADAGGADDGDEPARAARDGVLVGFAQHGELALPPDDRRVAPPRDRLVADDARQAPGLHRLGAAARGERLRRVALDGVADEAPRRVADQHLAGPGRLLEPLGDGDDVAGHVRLARADDDLAAV